MNDQYLIIRVAKEKKEALKNRAFDLHLDGGMSELVMALIDKELEQANVQPAPAPTANPSENQ